MSVCVNNKEKRKSIASQPSRVLFQILHRCSSTQYLESICLYRDSCLSLLGAVAVVRDALYHGMQSFQDFRRCEREVNAVGGSRPGLLCAHDSVRSWRYMRGLNVYHSVPRTRVSQEPIAWQFAYSGRMRRLRRAWRETDERSNELLTSPEPSDDPLIASHPPPPCAIPP